MVVGATDMPYLQDMPYLARQCATWDAQWMDEQEARARLVAKRDELITQRAVLTRPQPDQGSISFGKRVGDGTAMAVDRLSAVTAHDSLGEGLKHVERAMEKLDEGTYGRCDDCSDPIGEGRLDARPASTRCLKHS